MCILGVETVACLYLKMPDAHSFGVDPITCYSWNKDQTRLYLVFILKVLGVMCCKRLIMYQEWYVVYLGQRAKIGSLYIYKWGLPWESSVSRPFGRQWKFSSFVMTTELML